MRNAISGPLHTIALAALLGLSLVLVACSPETESQAEPEGDPETTTDSESTTASEPPEALDEVEAAIRAFRSKFHDLTASCAELYDMRNEVRQAGPTESHEEEMNDRLRDVGCISANSERIDTSEESRSEESSQGENGSSRPQNMVDTGIEERMQELCDEFSAALRESAGPPMLSDAATADLYDEVADRAQGTPLEVPIRSIADGYRRGDDYIDGGPVYDLCDD